MSVLRQMLPEDLLTYCQEHELLDQIVEKEQGNRVNHGLRQYSSHPPRRDEQQRRGEYRGYMASV